MRRIFKGTLAVILAMTLIIPSAGVAYASTKSNAEKVLKYYKKGMIKKAKQYNKKLPKNASKTCIKKLSKKAKASFRKVVKSYRLDSSIYSRQPYLWGYYLADMDGDKKAELLVKYGTCEADVRTAIYKYKNGKAKRVARIFSGHTYYCAYPGHAGIINVWGHMGSEAVSVSRLKSGKVKTTSYGARLTTTSYFPFRQQLDGHIRYDSNYKRSLDLKDLK